MGSITSHERLYAQLLSHLSKIYPGQEQALAQAIIEKLENFPRQRSPNNTEPSQARWDQSDIMLITYGDSIISDHEAPLKTLKSFLTQYAQDTFNIVHVLPFFPFSSDDGFSVIDFLQVNPDLGDWEDIRALREEGADLMIDLVINHVSRESLWFADYIADLEPGNKFFIELPQETDVSMVTRPRSSPLLVPVNTRRGVNYLWATFSDDQIDLNFANPDVLLTFLDIYLEYIRQGARFIRLDAVAFLWKTLGTHCVHLPQTHEVVKLLRTIMDEVTDKGIVLTETNVPNEENRSYFGNCDEAHMIYQFGLPPLLLHCFFKGSSQHLSQWAQTICDIPKGCACLNFSASHDGIGLRSLEGVLPDFEVEDLVDGMHRFGGFVSLKSNADGSTSPYEINISLFDAMQGTRRGPDQWQIQRFICSQAIMLSLKGIPAVYIHSLLATPNYLEGVERTGRTRSINRRKWRYEDLQSALNQEHTPNAEVLHALKDLIAIRKQCPAFHPDAYQEVIEFDHTLFGILRKALPDTADQDSPQQILAIHNITSFPHPIILKNRPDLSDHTKWRDIITGETLEGILALQEMAPYQVLWLEAI
ncbi:MAG: sugar phosphorylase [Pseudomonadales bacterium]|nr:sugar phosphorylase [Pseudomonadales bacterium]